MTAKTELSAPKRRIRAEVQQLVAEFVSSGMRRSEFCQSRGLSFSTLDRHLKKLPWKEGASDRIVIDTVVSEYCNHTPLHRQSVILERDAGLEISHATLDGWVLKVGELLIPTVGAMRRELISGTYIQADETPFDVQMHEGRGQNHQAYLCCYGRTAPALPLFHVRRERRLGC